MIIGIDPGQTGAIAVLDGDKVVSLKDMPVMGRTHGQGQQVDPYALAKIFQEIAPGGVEWVTVEQVGSMKAQGVASMFKFGESFGIVKGVVGALQLPIRFVTPVMWKKVLGLTGKDKDAARALAIQMHPEVATDLSRKKDCGRADAILIARYYR